MSEVTDDEISDGLAELESGLSDTDVADLGGDAGNDELEAIADTLEDNQATTEAAANEITDDHMDAIFDDIEDVGESDRLRMEWGHEAKANVAQLQQFITAHPSLKAAVLRMETIDPDLLRAGLELARKWKR